MEVRTIPRGGSRDVHASIPHFKVESTPQVLVCRGSPASVWDGLVPGVAARLWWTLSGSRSGLNGENKASSSKDGCGELVCTGTAPLCGASSAGSFVGSGAVC